MRWVPVLGGLVATAAAAIVLASIPAADEAQPAEAPDVMAVEAVTTSETVSPITPAGVRAEPDVAVPGLGESVAQLLRGEGYAEFVGTSELETVLDPNLVRVLVDADAVLVIPIEDGS